jgi:hypothetical protein
MTEDSSGTPHGGVNNGTTNNIPFMHPDEGKQHVEVSVELLHGPRHEHRHFKIRRDALLLAVLDEGARKLEVKLLPNPEAPLDQLRPVYEHHVGEALNLGMTLGDFLTHEHPTHHFAVDLVLAIQINTRWRVAPEKKMPPKAILALAGLSWEEYSLYFPADSVEPLPPDTPVELCRGQRFEAQRDGKYGEEVSFAYWKR